MEEKFIRRIDDLGRVVLPKPVRLKAFGTVKTDGEQVEIICEDDGTIIIKSYNVEE